MLINIHITSRTDTKTKKKNIKLSLHSDVAVGSLGIKISHKSNVKHKNKRKILSAVCYNNSFHQ